MTLANKKSLIVGKGAHNSERSKDTVTRCIEFLLENYRMRKDQGLHDDAKDVPLRPQTEIDEINRRRESIDTSQMSYDKSASELILESQREITSKKIQIAPKLSLASNYTKTGLDNVSGQKAGYENLDESMMEFSQQVEDMMSKQQHVSPKLKPTSYSTTKLNLRDNQNNQSPGTIKGHDLQDGLISSLKINTPFAIQTKGSKK